MSNCSEYVKDQFAGGGCRVDLLLETEQRDTPQALDDIDLRRRTNANLNKGEARNALARAVFFNRLGELRDRTFENQRHRALGLNLVSAAIILWNTVYLGRAAEYLRNQGRDIDDMLLSHAAPLGWEHISLTGDYLWSDMKLPEDGFRPLRTQNRQSEA